MRVENSASPPFVREGSGHIFVECLSGIKNVKTSPRIARSGIEISDKLCRLPDERESRQSVIFDLYRDEQSVRRIKGVDGQKAQEKVGSQSAHSRIRPQQR